MKLQMKISVISIFPLLLLFLIMLPTVLLQMNSMSKSNIAQARQILIETHQQQLKYIVDTAISEIAPLYEKSEHFGDEASKAALETLSHVKFGKDGYLFGYDSHHTRVLLGSSKQGIGQSFQDLKDTDGVFFVQQLVAASQSSTGDAFVFYRFPRLGSDQPVPKMSYAYSLPKWGIVIGAGIYIDNIDREVSQLADKEAAAQRTITWSVCGISLLILLVMIGVIQITGRKMVSPLVALKNRFTDIASANGDLTRRVRVESQDEVGELAQAFNRFADNIHHIIRNVSAMVEQLSGVAHELQSASKQVYQAVEEQKKETDMVATAMTEMNMSSVEVARSIGDAAEQAGRADEEGNEARQIVDSTCRSITTLEEDVSATADSINHLGQKVASISTILDVIKGIADQTNLLALNAAIEAARAGEHGRGFAVVADEVRSLASRTQKSTAEINQMIGELQQGAGDAVDKMQMSLNKARDAVDLANSANDYLERIARAINSISEMNDQVATAAEQQSSVGEDINRSIVRISDATQRNEAVTELVAKQCQELNRLGDSLHALVGQFRI